jgi:hypothetical protein
MVDEKKEAQQPAPTPKKKKSPIVVKNDDGRLVHKN